MGTTVFPKGIPPGRGRAVLDDAVFFKPNVTIKTFEELFSLESGTS